MVYFHHGFDSERSHCVKDFVVFKSACYNQDLVVACTTLLPETGSLFFAGRILETHRIINVLRCGLFLLFVGSVVAPSDMASADDINFNRQIRPILSKHCLVCHGGDEGSRQAGLRLDIRDEALAAIEPGDAQNSEMYSRITLDNDDRMPPPEHGQALSQAEIELVKNWIVQGAPYDKHWSFVAPVKSPPPILDNAPAQWARKEIDLFVAARLAEHDLLPSLDEDPRRLIRRLALDLTGLPPSWEQVERFANAPTDQNYTAIVNELLASESFGEHWAAMWLDIARYADTIGYAEDKHREIWPWRDWVIRAFNSNMPYDQFTIEQIAGDLLPNATVDQRLATAFHRNTLNNTEGGTDDEEFRIVAVKDRISTTLNAWMGLTLRCAECHSHKYDPITQQEYYQFMAFFNQTQDADKNDDSPLLDVFPAGRESQLALLDEEIKTLELQIQNGHTSLTDKEYDALKADLAQKVQQRFSPIRVPTIVEVTGEHLRKTNVLTRGSFLQPAEEVTPSVMTAFPAMPEDSPLNRLGVARWLVSEDNPLTARVAVNRFWARLFGTGIVETEEDFGTQGSPPTHPELLDWLAVDFRENGWDVKRLLKQIVTSSTYRQTSIATADRLERDPRNVMYSRGPRFRLRAEVVRDQALAVAGLLSHKMYGPPVYPPNPVKQVRSAFTGGTVWNESEGEDRYRRALYTYLKRSAPHPLFETFDMATREVCNLRRIRTNTPLQSFMTLNDRTFLEAAQALAVKMYQFSDEPGEQLEQGFRLALFRSCNNQQKKSLSELYQNTLKKYRESPKEAKSMIDAVSDFGVDEQTIASHSAELATLTVVANVILNLDSFLTR